MATPREEADALKIRIAKKEGDKRITVINHTLKQRFSCTVLEAFKTLCTYIDKRQDYVLHIVDHEKTRTARRENLKGSTRITINCYTPENYKGLRSQIDRYFEIAGDPTFAPVLMEHALELCTNQILKDWLAAGYEKKRARPESDSNEIPDWLKL
jgi:hypothetical protein